MEASVYDLLMAGSIAALIAFVTDLLRQMIFPWIKLGNAVLRKKLNLETPEES